MFEIFIFILIGVFAGIITGLTPGIHINLVALLTLTFSPVLFSYFSPLLLAVFLISMSVTHTFLDAIPSIFLGVPEAETALSVLPGHKLLLEGRGYEAVKLTVIGSLLALIIAVFLVFLLIPSVSFAYPLIQEYIVFILIIASLFLILRERKSRIFALIIFLLSGVLGLGVLNLNINHALFPLLSGLFGTSMLILSLHNKIKIPKQRFTEVSLPKKEIGKSLGSCLISGTLTSFLPGLGPAQAAIIGSQIVKKMSTEGFLILVGGANTLNMVLSFIALYVLNKARNGSIIAVSKIIDINLDYLILFLGSALFVAGISVFLALNLTKVFSKIIERINYQKLCLSIIILISVLVLILSGFLGFLVLIVSTSVGILPQMKQIGRNHLMGCLLVPVILFFLF